mmetsp:Transcript_83926/g.166581  ORF Transcript_83926/g.166581 Transcript_83926/m.166581 type:complete len:269 (+) Transcript_83926:37-843(+)
MKSDELQRLMHNITVIGSCLPVGSLSPAADIFGEERSPSVLSPSSVQSRPQGRLSVPPLVDSWQRLCTRSDEGSVSERSLPYVARVSLRSDDSWRSDLGRPSNDTANKPFNKPFLKACRQLDDKNKEAWQQMGHAVTGSFSARTWGEIEAAVSGQERRHRNASRISGWPKDKLLQSQSTVAPSSPTCSVASISSVASTMADKAQVRHSRLSGGDDSFRSVEQHVSNFDCQRLLMQKHLATQHFDLSVDDWNEIEEEFFPEDRPVVDCG